MLRKKNKWRTQEQKQSDDINLSARCSAVLLSAPTHSTQHKSESAASWVSSTAPPLISPSTHQPLSPPDTHTHTHTHTHIHNRSSSASQTHTCTLKNSLKQKHISHALCLFFVFLSASFFSPLFLSHSHWLLITNSFPMLCLLFLKHTHTHTHTPHHSYTLGCVRLQGHGAGRLVQAVRVASVICLRASPSAPLRSLPRCDGSLALSQSAVSCERGEMGFDCLHFLLLLLFLSSNTLWGRRMAIFYISLITNKYWMLE